MIPVDQTTFGFPGGNCFSACVASLLECPIDGVPYFMGSTRWWEDFERWLLPLGYYPILVPIDGTWAPPGLHILSGTSDRGARHSVVARGREIVHDPHPDRSGLATRDRTIVIVPLDPAEGFR